MYGDCDEPRLSGDTRYCEEHAYVEFVTAAPALCAHEGCTNTASWGDYCKDHVCKYGSCTEPRAEGSDFCEEHTAP